MAARKTDENEAEEPGRPFAEGEPRSEGAASRVAADGEQSVVTKVWAAAGPIPKSSVLQTAIQSVRNAIPVVFQLEANITGAEKVERDGQPGTEFEVTVSYTPRAVAGKEDPVDMDRVIRGLDVPRSFDGIGGHNGDPDFHQR
jgi:hypothetical protein